MLSVFYIGMTNGESQRPVESVYWVEIERVQPNPFQPRKIFDERKLEVLANSIREYGILQPLIVTKNESLNEDGGFTTQYELIAGERRLRAARIAGLSHVPVIIRSNESSEREKLELAIVENLQREDLTPIDRAEAFQKLVKDFGLTHIHIAERVGKSREYISNNIRLLTLPQDIQIAINTGVLTEGHARPLLMLTEKQIEQRSLFNEICNAHLTVREAERIARRIASDRIRKLRATDTPEIQSLEQKLGSTLGTRVHIETKDMERGGRILIDFFNREDLDHLVGVLEEKDVSSKEEDTKNEKKDDDDNHDDPYSFQHFSI